MNTKQLFNCLFCLFMDIDMEISLPLFPIRLGSLIEFSSVEKVVVELSENGIHFLRLKFLEIVILVLKRRDRQFQVNLYQCQLRIKLFLQKR